MFVSVFLTSIYVTGSRFIHLTRTDSDSFFWWLSDFSIVYVYHIFTNSSVSDHLGYFHVLAIVNSTAMNTGVHVSFRIVAFSGHMPNSGVAVSYGKFIPSFLRKLHTLLHYGCISLFLPTVYECSLLLHILSSIYCLQIFCWWPFWLVIPHCSSDCISLIINDVEHFSCVYLPSVCLLWRNVCLGLLPIFWLGCLLFWYWAIWAAYIQFGN